MDRFTINDLENITGIKAHTLRIWEKRYAHLLQPKRTQSSHRYYDNDDLKKILKISFLYHNGYKISRIAHMSGDEIEKITNITPDSPLLEQSFISRLLEAALHFDEQAFDELLSQAIEQCGFEKTILQIIYPYFEKVGRLWMNNSAIPAQEHFSSNIIRNKIIFATDQLKQPARKENRSILLFQPEGEYHEIPLLFISYLLKKSGIHHTYIGSNMSTQVLQEYCNSRPADILYVHIITNFMRTTLNDYLISLRTRFPGKQIWISGPLIDQVDKHIPDIQMIQSTNELFGLLKM